jgi:hypothetical protein
MKTTALASEHAKQLGIGATKKTKDSEKNM